MMIRTSNVLILSAALFFNASPGGSLSALQIIGAGPGPNVVFSQAFTQSLDGAVTTGMIRSAPVTGSPFSATQEEHSLQILGDGTRIEQTDTGQLSRDSQGRTRTEAPHGQNETASIVTIQDPVAQQNVLLRLADKMATQMPLPNLLPAVAATSAMKVASGGAMVSVRDDTDGIMIGRGAAVSVVDGPASASVVVSRMKNDGMKPATEDLGTQNVNGVMAKGTRTTMTIPAGKIGNDRPIQVVNERWYSDDLHMVVKSSNSDPRFGTTEFSLTNIIRAEPDPSLFQIPPDFTTTAPKPMTLHTKE